MLSTSSANASTRSVFLQRGPFQLSTVDRLGDHQAVHYFKRVGADRRVWSNRSAMAGSTKHLARPVGRRAAATRAARFHQDRHGFLDDVEPDQGADDVVRNR